MDEWVRLFMMVPAKAQNLANAMAAELDFDSGGGETFETPLSPSGKLPATYFGASSLVRERTLPMILKEFLPQIPSARVYQEAEGWTWRTALQDAGLRQITSWE
ncbi:MAG: hypothetical protein KAJ42_03845 [Gemmatimonadetes bacterium]|nr:hypothetical protein [Gemmatimonadota bacterium]